MTAEEVLLDFEDEPMVSGSEDDFSDLGESAEDFGSDDEDPSPPLSLSCQPRALPPSLQPRAPTPPPSPT